MCPPATLTLHVQVQNIRVRPAGVQLIFGRSSSSLSTQFNSIGIGNSNCRTYAIGRPKEVH